MDKFEAKAREIADKLIYQSRNGVLCPVCVLPDAHDTACDHNTAVIAAALKAAADEARAETARSLEAESLKYRQADGNPGPLGLNCWGWRGVADILKKQADRLRT